MRRGMASHPGAVEVYLQVRYVLWAAVDSSRQITSAAQTRDRARIEPGEGARQKDGAEPKPRGGLAWYSETKTKLHLFLGARRGRHPLGQFNSPIVPEAVDGKPRGRGPPRPGGEVVISWRLTPVSTKSTFYLALAQP